MRYNLCRDCGTFSWLSELIPRMLSKTTNETYSLQRYVSGSQRNSRTQYTNAIYVHTLTAREEQVYQTLGVGTNWDLDLLAWAKM